MHDFEDASLLEAPAESTNPISSSSWPMALPRAAQLAAVSASVLLASRWLLMHFWLKRPKQAFSASSLLARPVLPGFPGTETSNSKGVVDVVVVPNAISSTVLEDVLASEPLAATDSKLCVMTVELGSSHAQFLALRLAARIVSVNPDAESSALHARLTRDLNLDIVHIRGNGFSFDARDTVEGRNFALVVVDVGAAQLSSDLLQFLHTALEPLTGVALIAGSSSIEIVNSGFVIEKQLGPFDWRDISRRNYRQVSFS